MTVYKHITQAANMGICAKLSLFQNGRGYLIGAMSQPFHALEEQRNKKMALYH